MSTPAGANAMPQIGDIVWATKTDPLTNAPVEPVSSYLSDAPRITATMPARALAAGSRVEAAWEYNDTSLDAFTTPLEVNESIAETWIVFAIDRDPDVPWPPGVYGISISLDGAAVQRAEVEVVDPS